MQLSQRKKMKVLERGGLKLLNDTKPQNIKVLPCGGFSQIASHTSIQNK